jgi:hypothetical protein
MVPVKVYIGLMIGLGALVFFFGAANGDARTIFLSLFPMGLGALAYYMRYGRPSKQQYVRQSQEVTKSLVTVPPPTLTKRETREPVPLPFSPPVSESPGQCESGVDTDIMQRVPELALEIQQSAIKFAKTMGAYDAWFIDCIVELELSGVFEMAVTILVDPNLASAFVDAAVRRATRQEPTTPPTCDLIAGLSYLYRGVAKYALASKEYKVPDPGLLLFGMEFARAKGNALDPFYAVSVASVALDIRQSGAKLALGALKDRVPQMNADEVLPTAYHAAKYVIREGTEQKSKFADQSKEYQDLVLGSLQRVATGEVSNQNAPLNFK